MKSPSLKPNKLTSILTLSCPRCREGQLFVNRSTYKKGFTEMNKTCSNCGLNFQREPGFYFGAAYVSYGLTVALWVSWLVALITLDKIGIVHFSIREHAVFYVVSGVILLVGLVPIVYRLSRSIWIHLFVKGEGS